MSEFNTEDLDEVIASTNGSLVQMLALQLKNELAKNTALTSQLESVVAENEKKSRCLGFFASVIKSGEEWTSVCQHEYSEASKTPATDAFLAEVRAQVWIEAKEFTKSMLACDSVDQLDFLFDGKVQQLRQEAK